MIFSRFFRPKWQHPDPAVRLQAIQQLNPQQTEDKSQLHELAFNDADIQVSLAALHKLDSFALWSKMADVGSSERLRKKAAQHVELQISNPASHGLSREERRRFLLESGNVKLLEKLLKEDQSLAEDDELVLTLLQRLGKPQLNRQVFFSCDNPVIQLALLQQMDSEAELQRVLKKCTHHDVIQLTQSKLQRLQDLRDKPPVIMKQARLLLAKLMALKEQTDYQQVIGKRDQLTTEFKQLQQEFTWLAAEKQQELLAKYSEVKDKLDKHMAQLQVQWQATEAERAVQLVRKNAGAKAQDCLDRIAFTVEGDIAQITTDKVAQLRHELDACCQQLASLLAQQDDMPGKDRQQLEHLHVDLLAGATTLDRLPQFRHAVEQGQQQLTQLQNMPLPQDFSQIDAAKQFLHEQKAQWGKLSQDYRAYWPQALSQQWQAWRQDWQRAISKLQEAKQQELQRCRSKLRAVGSLIEQGKYRAAIALYHKVEQWFMALPEEARVSLTRQFDKVKTAIINLQDWQSYIAEPRKPALLAETEALLAQMEGVDIDERAQQVKQLRSQWRSLGVAETGSDQALNQAFDAAIEQAFQPCREHYAKQQQQRDENLRQRQKLLTEFSALADSEVAEKQRASRFRELQQRWSQCGEVDYKQRDALNQQYKQVTLGLKAKVNAYYQHNAEEKQRLLKQAQALLQLEDNYEATTKAKALQEQWQHIDFAGRNKDQTLWTAFRQVNDQLFAIRKQQSEQQRQAIDSQCQDIEVQLEQAQQLLQQLSLGAETEKLQEMIAAVFASIEQLPAKLRAKMMQKAKAVRQEFVDNLALLQQQQSQGDYQRLFALLADWQQGDMPTGVNALPARLRQSFNAREPSTLARNELTLMLEIIADKASPTEETEARKTVQMMLMQEKLQRGIKKDKDEILAEWLSHGPLMTEDKALLARVKQVFVVEG